VTEWIRASRCDTPFALAQQRDKRERAEVAAFDLLSKCIADALVAQMTALSNGTSAFGVCFTAERERK